MYRLISRASWIGLLALCSAQARASGPDELPCAAPQGSVTVALARDAAGRITADYRFSSLVGCVRFDDSSPIRKSAWQFETPGAVLQSDGVTVYLEQPANRLLVTLKDAVKDGSLDRIYTPVIKFQDGSAAAVYTEYLMLDRSVADTTLHFEGIDRAGIGASANTTTFKSSDQRTYVVLGRPAIQSFGVDAVIHDRKLPSAITAGVRRAVEFAKADFGDIRLDQASTTFLITAASAASDSTSWRGDTLPGFVRLNFSGPGWDRMSTELDQEVLHFAIHELFHLVNSHVGNQSAGNGALSLLEGSAEAAAEFTLLKHGVIDQDRFDARREMAIKRCMRIAGKTLSEKERADTAEAPYLCGNALADLLVEAIRHSGTSAESFFKLWTSVRMQIGQAEYGWPNVFAAARGLVPKERQRSLQIIEHMAESKLPWDEGLSALQSEGILEPVAGEDARKPWRAEYFTQLAITRLLGEHCHGRRGNTATGRSYVLDAPADSCKGVPDGFELASLAGHPLPAEGLAAIDAQIHDCAAVGHVRITDAAGHGQDVSCHPLPPMFPLYRFVR